eukprot:5176334-Pleurochrysis_carterae.AAC.1
MAHALHARRHDNAHASVHELTCLRARVRDGKPPATPSSYCCSIVAPTNAQQGRRMAQTNWIESMHARRAMKRAPAAQSRFLT